MTYLDALLALPLLAAASIGGVPVARTSLFGFDVAGRVLEATAAAQELSTLAARVRTVVRWQAARLAAEGVHGRFSVRVAERKVVIIPHVEGGAAGRVIEEVLWACRWAGLYADLGDGSGQIVVRA